MEGILDERDRPGRERESQRICINIKGAEGAVYWLLSDKENLFPPITKSL